MTTLAELIERLEKSEGPNFALEKLIGETLEPGRMATGVSPRCYTSSIDDAVTLMGRILPGWKWGVTQGPDDGDEFQGNVWPNEQPFPAELDIYCYHPKPAIAIVLATLKALEATRT